MATSDRLSAALSERYRIERELGAGGMATVYLAEDLKHDRKVATCGKCPRMRDRSAGARSSWSISAMRDRRSSFPVE